MLRRLTHAHGFGVDHVHRLGGFRGYAFIHHGAIIHDWLATVYATIKAQQLNGVNRHDRSNRQPHRQTTRQT